MENGNSEPGRARILNSIGPALVGAAIVGLLALAVAALLWPTAPQLPDFDGFDDVAERKQAFFEFLAPIVRDQNERVLDRRERLLRLAERLRAGAPVGWLDRRWLERLAEQYEVAWNRDEPLESVERLERRVDAIPVPLALVQAATESGWGRSRFAVEGNNLFGHWCYQRGCGLVPSRRNEDAAHEVAAFDSVVDSVARYLDNLNTHAAYAPLREIRVRLRRAGRPLTAMSLADGLVRYSERRDEYVDEIKTVIRVNRPIIEQVIEPL